MLLTVERVLFLKKVDVFAGIDDDALAGLAVPMQEREFRAGESIFREGDLGREMFIVLEGRVRIHRGEQTFDMVGSAGFFGELAALDPEPRSASATAVEDTRALALNHTVLLEELMNNSVLAQGIIRYLVRRFRAAPAREASRPPDRPDGGGSP
jgi:CRP-like cAMP-binding protein